MTDDYRVMTDADLRDAHERLVSRLLRAWQRKRDATAEWEALCDEFAACKLEETLREVMPAARKEAQA